MTNLAKILLLDEGVLERTLTMVDNVGKFLGLAPRGIAKTDEGFVRSVWKTMAI